MYVLNKNLYANEMELFDFTTYGQHNDLLLFLDILSLKEKKEEKKGLEIVVGGIGSINLPFYIKQTISTVELFTHNQLSFNDKVLLFSNMIHLYQKKSFVEISDLFINNKLLDLLSNEDKDILNKQQNNRDCNTYPRLNENVYKQVILEKEKGIKINLLTNNVDFTKKLLNHHDLESFFSFIIEGSPEFDENNNLVNYK
jgi:hypothetical protein